MIESEVIDAITNRMDAIEADIKEHSSIIKSLETKYKKLADFVINAPKCKVCGTEDVVSNGMCHECSKAKMREKSRKVYERDFRAIHCGTETKQMVRPKKSIDEFQNEAAANGMSYGQWQALQTIKEQKGE